LASCLALLSVEGVTCHSPASPELPPADFAIRFEYGVCTTDVLDTFKGTFRRDTGMGNVTIDLVLPEESLRAIHEEIVAARFFDYPAEFRVNGNLLISPAMRYRLEVRSDGTTHTVGWTDGTRPSTAEADRLRNLFTKLIDRITSLPSVKALPMPQLGCM